jgi:ADP-heptose:LPS heptosyltransferase
VLAILKPDHIGDLILAAPAIRYLARRIEDVRLFVDANNLELAQTLFPGIDTRGVSLGHLKKSEAGGRLELAESLAGVSECDQVVCLRTDAVLNRGRLRGLFRRSIFVSGDNFRHESLTNRDQLGPFFGRYDCEDFWPGLQRPWPTQPQRIAFSMGSGFPGNRWSVLRWAELGLLLLAQGCDIFVLRTPREQGEVATLARTLDLPDENIIDCSSIPALLTQLRALDVVIASDGGAGHICSLALPVLTIAGSVPFRRFAPFGRANRVITLDLPCSPCINYLSEAINGCFTYECSYGIDAAAVAAALARPMGGFGCHDVLPGGAKLYFGLSHAS